MKPTVGQQLREARESRGISIEEAVKATFIRRDYLNELENDHPELLPSAAQARGFLRLYADYLGLSGRDLIARWEEDALDKVKPAEEGAAAIPQEGQPDEPEKPASKPPKAEPDKPEKQPAEVDSDGTEKDSPAGALQNLLKRLPKLGDILPKKKETSRKSTEPEPEPAPQPQAEADPHPGRSSKEIFADIGNALRERRSALELSLSDSERFTSISRNYLSGMENSQFDQLPSTVQGRGMLNNYAHFLGLDETWVMDAYASALQTQRIEQTRPAKPKVQPPLTVKLNIPEKWRRFLNPDLILGGIFIIALFTFIIWGSAQVFSSAEPTATEAPSISEVLQQTPSLSPEAITADAENGEAANNQPTPVPGVVVAQPTPTQIATVNAAPLQLYILASDRSYMQVVVDGIELFDGRVAPGDVFTYSGEETISFTAGNAAALEVYFNQDYLGDLGGVGDVVRINFAPQGLSTPTPAATQTATPEAPPAEGDAMDLMEGPEN